MCIKQKSDYDIKSIISSSNNNNNQNILQHKTTTLKIISNDCKQNLNQSQFKNRINEFSNKFENSVRQFLSNLQRKNNVNINVLLSRLDSNAYYMPQNILF